MWVIMGKVILTGSKILERGPAGCMAGGWWRMLMNERTDSVPFFVKAAKLVAIVQVSSAAIERVFSQLTFIRRAVGDNTNKGDMMELRAYIRCNNGLGGDFNINGE
mmetsp:Transcript_21933/g.47630  ORF Transcript_21933/g.47630 Transcript_21933/m.47630 type:complete len:106 (+) Transcript_21933:28-345(+)